MQGSRAGHRRGARELGLEIDWRFDFVPHGTVLRASPEAVILDVGNRLEPGILDQHQDGSHARSTAELVFQRPDLVYDHLLGPWLEADRRGVDLQGRKVPMFVVTHIWPDLDGIVSAVLVQELIATGSFPRWAASLVEYSAEVDQGRYRIVPSRPESLTGALHLGLQAYLHWAESVSTDEERMRQSIEFVREAAEAVAEAAGGALDEKTFFPGRSEHAVAWTVLDFATPTVEALKRDQKTFEREDLRGHRRQSIDVLDPRSGMRRPVDALILENPPRSALHKYWARSAGQDLSGDSPVSREAADLYVVCLEETESARRVVISVPGDSGLSLRGLGQALEEREHALASRQEGGEDRPGPPRFPDPWCKVANPWYDGRGHSRTIVDSPSAPRFSRLPFDEILECVQTFAATHGVTRERGVITFFLLLEPSDPRARHEEASGQELGVGLGGAEAARRLLEDARQVSSEWEALPEEVRTRVELLGTEKREVRTIWCPDHRDASVVQRVDIDLPSGVEVAAVWALVEWLGARTRESECLCGVVSMPQWFQGQMPDALRAHSSTVVGLHQTPIVHVACGGLLARLPPDFSEQTHDEAALQGLTVALQRAAVDGLRRRIVRALDGPAVHGASEIRQALLSFQVRHHDWVANLPLEPRAIVEALDAHTQLRANLVEVAKEIDRAAENARDEVQGKLEHLLLVLGILAVPEAGSALVQMEGGHVALSIGLMLAVGGLGLWWTQARKEVPSRDAKLVD